VSTDAFEKDFGYLIPFIEKVGAAAAGADPSVRAELSGLVSGEAERWARIRALLSGQRPPRPARNPEPPPSGGFTVGSLRAKR
jgi:hypothetical protein